MSLERSTVLFRDPTNSERRFVPLLLSKCDLPDTLRRYRYIDYTRGQAEAVEELVRAVRGKEQIVQAAVAPTAPSKEETQPESRIATLVGTLEGHADTYIDCAIATRDGTLAISASTDYTVRVWDLRTSVCLHVLSGHTDTVNSVAIRPNRNNEIVSCSNDGTVRRWDLRTGEALASIPTPTDQASGLVLTSDGRFAICTHFTGTLSRTDLGTNISTPIFADAELNYADLAISRDDRFVVVAGERRFDARGAENPARLEIFDLLTDTSVGLLHGHTDSVVGIALSADASLVFSSSIDRTIRIWRRETLQCIGTLEGHEAFVGALALSLDETLLASCSGDDTVRIWDWNAGTTIETISVDNPFSLSFTPDGRKLLVGTSKGQIYVFSIDVLTAPTLAPPSTRRYVNAKVVLVGDTGVGKSGLAHRLAEDRFVATESTHGMQVWRLELPLDPDDTFDREALLWDLAGQEDYRLIHQLFLDETALALMVINPQKDDPFAEVGQWMKAVSAAVGSREGRSVAKLLVAARVDVGNIKVSQRKIDRFVEEQGFAGYIATSAKRGHNCPQLKELIAKHIPWSELPWTSTPQLLANIKQAVMDMRDRKEIRLLRFAELAQRLEQTLSRHTFDASDIRTAVRLLANQGLVMPLKFGDLVLMRPELLNGYASAVVRAARTHVDEIGSVTEADVYREDFDFHGVDRLPRADEELLLRAMIQTFLDKALCIAEDTPAGRQLIFPSQFRRERPIPTHPEIFVSYTFAGEWQTIYTTVVVRLWYSREFEQKELWQNAAEFQTSKGRTAGLLISRDKEGDATISIFFDAGVPDELKWAFIKYVHDHLARYARNVRRDRRYACQNCGKPVADLDTVRERLDACKDFIYCQKCDKKVLLIDWVEQQLASDPVARRVLGMVATEKREREKQALQEILTAHLIAICGEANQIFRKGKPLAEVEFKDNGGKPSGRKVYVQLRGDDAYEVSRSAAGAIVVTVDPTLIAAWRRQTSDVYLVLRDDESEAILWMNVTGRRDSKFEFKARVSMPPRCGAFATATCRRTSRSADPQSAGGSGAVQQDIRRILRRESWNAGVPPADRAPSRRPPLTPTAAPRTRPRARRARRA